MSDHFNLKLTKCEKEMSVFRNKQVRMQPCATQETGSNGIIPALLHFSLVLLLFRTISDADREHC